MKNQIKFNGFYEIQRSTISEKSRSINYYLEKLGNYFDKLQVFSTAGDFRPPYPFQWIAKSVVFDGWDDCLDGVGGTPFEALQDLYKQIKIMHDPIRIQMEESEDEKNI